VEFWTKWMISRVYKKEKKCRFHQTARIPFSARFYYPMAKGREDNQKISKGYAKLSNIVNVLIFSPTGIIYLFLISKLMNLE